MPDAKKIFDSFPLMPVLPMKDHPRLFIDADAIARVNQPANTPILEHAQAQVEAIAEKCLESVVPEYDITGHNSNLIRGRIMQTKVYSLLVRYLQTKEERYRLQVLACIKEIDSWVHWSWFDWRADAHPDWEEPVVAFDLSFAENSMTIAIAYDLLYHTLSDAEREIFYSVLRRHHVISEFLRHARLGPGCARDWGEWQVNEKINWRAVICGGLGLLALAFYDEMEEARQAVAYCDPAVMELMEFADSCGGSWPEGMGYFAYTLRYAVPFLLSYETSTGKKHPAFALLGTAKMVEFFLNMQPSRIACTFGDSNGTWESMGYGYMLCRRLGQEWLCPLLDAQASLENKQLESWPHYAERVLFAYREAVSEPPVKRENVVELYPVTNYAVMADKLPSPDFYMAIRGGNTRGYHEHNDLSSFHFVSGGERFITSLSTDEYLDSTFSERRNELFEMSPAAKNVLLINGIGMNMYSEVQEEKISCCGFDGLRMDCTEAMGKKDDLYLAVDKYIRTYLLLSGDAFLIIDDAVMPHASRFDARLHTYMLTAMDDKGFVLTSEINPDNKLRIAYSASHQSVFLSNEDAPTKPKKASRALRCVSEKLHNDYALATLLTKDTLASVSLSCNESTITVTAVVDGKDFSVTINR